MKNIYYLIAIIFVSIPSAFAHTGETVDEPYFHMMDWHFGSSAIDMFNTMGIFGWLLLLNWIVWLGVGILGFIWLWRKINK